MQESETRKLDRHIFNEAYLMHTSTSPQYAIIASCDVAAAMMEPPGGTALVEESITEALDFRRAMRKVDAEFGRDWWFKVWGPEKLAPEGMGSREDWMLKANEKWHGFGNLAPGFNMLDPIKATVITPGLDVSGKFAKTGIPASIVTKYLAEHGVIVEKTGLYSFFIMFTIGITKGRWNTLVTALQQFKDDYDKNQPMWRILPEFVAKQPRYERVGLRDLCQQIHDMYKANDVARVTTEMYLSDMQPAMKPSDAFACMAHREIDRVEIDKLEGRVTSVLLTPYPPGIPLLIPGERFNRTIVEYLKFARTFNEKFPGFETDIHGLVEEEKGGKKRYFMDCVRRRRDPHIDSPRNFRRPRRSRAPRRRTMRCPAPVARRRRRHGTCLGRPSPSELRHRWWTGMRAWVRPSRQSNATLGAASPSEIAIWIVLRTMSFFGGEVRRHVELRVGEQQATRHSRKVEEVRMGEPAVGAQTGVKRGNRSQQILDSQTAFDQRRNLAFPANSAARMPAARGSSAVASTIGSRVMSSPSFRARSRTRVSGPTRVGGEVAGKCPGKGELQRFPVARIDHGSRQWRLHTGLFDQFLEVGAKGHALERGKAV